MYMQLSIQSCLYMFGRIVHNESSGEIVTFGKGYILVSDDAISKCPGALSERVPAADLAISQGRQSDLSQISHHCELLHEDCIAEMRC